MRNLLNRLFENHSLIFKLIIYLISVVSIVYLFPRGGQFKYQFQKGKVWHYDDFYAPFDFAILKTDSELAQEKSEILKNFNDYYIIQDSISENVLRKVNWEARLIAADFPNNPNDFKLGFQKSNELISQVYKFGYVKLTPELEEKNQAKTRIRLVRGNVVTEHFISDFFTSQTKSRAIQNAFVDFPDPNQKTKWVQMLEKNVLPNMFFDANLSKAYIDQQLQSISPNKGLVTKGSIIISKGDIIEDVTFDQLNSLNEEYNTLTWSKENFYWLIISYTVLVALILMMLLLFINRYRPDIGDNISKVTFLFANMFLVVLVTMLMLKYNAKYLYILPYTLIPLLIKAFLDPRMGLFTHVLTILLLGFLVPNSFEFIFIQLVAGIVTILTVSELNKRANLFLSVGKITGVYLLTYVAFTVTHEGNAANVDKLNIYLFILNGLMTASLIVPFIFIYEKLFGLVSDETLREFSDTNHKLLRELNEKAPGTFQHSMQVANLAESAAKEIGANALLVRTGAMYHDIGKIFNPMYFVENQSTSVNPHSDLDPEESARIIIDHVILGIELAKKNNLPDRLIDFIRTHHGTNLVYYFYKKEEEYNPDATDINKFRYPGPIPFSKETAIVMICDACEAASKSLKEPNAKTIDLFVEKIVKNQMENGQFQNADITFREIEKVKKVVKKKLKNIYHIRIEYPE
ncbi:MAG: HDIG domain-containing protein [Flavobacteriaceae bacterium]|nr:HDIG domain-containing protein [Flavobacteriaceae bacterium]